MHKEYSPSILKKLKNITLQEICSTHFDVKYKDVIVCNEFFQKPGKEHYRFLSYISTLFNNTTIIDIGSHRGSSALALSYNSTNTIHSFDIVSNVVNEKLKAVENIQFHIENQ
jgi:predicted O-methyltransferase YrrM